jgi:dTDP-glucose 4,6-dehydratase
MRLLITGGLGFIGSNLVRYFLAKYPEYKIINIDAMTYAAHPENLSDVEKNPNYTFIKGSITDKALVKSIVSGERYGKIDAIINLAAESHVDRSIADPFIFVQTNVFGTQVLLDAALTHGQFSDATDGAKKYAIRYVQVSTDEVYGSLGPTGYFSEDTPLAANSPYSASKAGADLLCRAYFHTYGLPVVITRCSNNYGPFQNPEKLIPLFINNALNDKPVPVYGDGLNVRDWLHVEDHCQAIDLAFQKGVPGEVYNIGGHNERKNMEITQLILKELDKPESLINYVEDRLGHDRRYAIDPTKITTELGWKPKYTFETGIKETINWYKNNKAWLKAVSSKTESLKTMSKSAYAVK